MSSAEIVAILEGDVSDIEDAAFQDDVEEDILGTAVRDRVLGEETPAGEILNVDCFSVPVEIHMIQDDEEEDLDDTPLTVQLGRQNQSELPIHEVRNRYWRHKSMEPIDVTYNSTYSDPPNDVSPLNYFEKFIDNIIIQNLVDQTNLYFTQKTGKSISTSIFGMSQFLGIHILAGVVHMPKYRMYWADSTRYEPIAGTMPRDRFCKLRNYLHANNNMVPIEHEDYDKLFKIRPFVDSLRNNFLKIEPEEYNSVHEMMIPLKSHTSMLQYIKSKPHRWGVKVFARAEVSGIVYDFEIYVGKGTKVKDGPLGMSGNVVLRLVDDLPKHQNHKLFVDNWFASYDLAVELKKLGIYMVAILRKNRLAGCSLQTDASLKKSGHGSYDYRVETNENIMLLKWFDNKAVHIISSYKSQEPIENVRRWSVSAKQYVNVPRPAIVTEYNTFMGVLICMTCLFNSTEQTSRGVGSTSELYFTQSTWHASMHGCYIEDTATRKKRNTDHCLILFCDIAAGLLKRGTTESRKRGRPTASPMPGPSKTRRKEKAPRPVTDVRYDGVGHNTYLTSQDANYVSKVTVG